MLTSSLRVSARRLRCSASLALGSTRCHQFADWANTKPASREQKEEVPRSTPLGRSSFIGDEIRERRCTTSIVNGNRVAAQSPQKTREELKEKTTETATPPSAMSSWQEFRKKASAAELRRLMREYGPVAAAFHASVFFTTLGTFYSVIDYGLDVPSLVKDIPMIANNLPHPSAGNLAVAWGLTTLTGPIRAVMTITLTPRVARFWWGREARRKLKNASAGKENEKKP